MGLSSSRGLGERRTRHRFYVSTVLNAGNIVDLPTDVENQIRRVLRMIPGDDVILFDNTGNEYSAELEKISPEGVSARVICDLPTRTEPTVRTVIYQAMIRHEPFEMVLQKCTELGATSFVPLLTSRVQGGRPLRTASARATRWKSIIREAAEQSNRVRLPSLKPAMCFREALSTACANGLTIILSEHTQKPSLKVVLSGVLNQVSSQTTISLMIGPVGGFLVEEVEQARAAGALAASLGPRILRAETASIAALSIVLYELGELGG